MSNGKNRKSNSFDYEGVKYTPSQERYNNTDQDKWETDNTSSKKRPVGKRTQKGGGKSSYGLFMTLTIGSGIIVCLGVFWIFYSILSGGEKPAIPGNTSENPSFAQPSFKELTVFIQKVSTNGEIDCVDILTNTSMSIKITGTTELKNKYGQSIVLAEFKRGDIVLASLSEPDNEALSLKQSSEAWEFKDIQDVIVDAANKTVKVGNQTFAYTDKLIAIYKGENYNIENLTPKDVVSLKGYQNTLISVSLDKSTGKLKISNYENIKDGIIEVESLIYKNLSESEEFEIMEGVYKVVVKGSNIESFVQDVKISSDTVTVIDLLNVQLKTGLLSVSVNQPDYELSINGNNVPSLSEPIILDYGVYTVIVTKKGFTDWKSDVIINAPAIAVNAVLSEQVQMGKLSIASEPSDASVYIDNAYIGLSPVEESVTYGQHRILIRKEGYEDMSVSIAVDKESDSYLITLPPVTNQTTGTYGTYTPGTENTETNTEYRAPVTESTPQVSSTPVTDSMTLINETLTAVY